MANQVIRPSFSLASSSGGSAYFQKDYSYSRKSSQRRRGSDNDFDPYDGNASLTYSAASSVNSGGSSIAGESGDSSFADVMRVLDTEQPQDLTGSIRKTEGGSPVHEPKGQKEAPSGQSVATSLVYSVESESHLKGASLGAGENLKQDSFQGERGLLFAPAEPGRIKKNTRNQKVGGKIPASPGHVKSGMNSAVRPYTPQSRSINGNSSPTTSEDTPTRSPPDEKSTPPSYRINKFHIEDADQDDEIWYTRWWMFCFPNASQNLMSKR